MQSFNLEKQPAEEFNTIYYQLFSLTEIVAMIISPALITAQLTFNRGVSSPPQCQGCQQTLSFLYSYPSEVILSINWLKGSSYLSIGYVSVNSGELRFIGVNGYENRITWQSNDPASITISDLTANDTDTYWCFVYFQSGNYIVDSTYLNTSSPLCKWQNSG